VDRNNPNFFVTCGDDNKIMLWESTSHRFLTIQNISEKQGRRLNSSRASSTSRCPDWQCARAISFSPDSQFVVVGTNEGEISVVELKTMEQVALHNLNESSSQNVIGKRDNWIQALKFSPNGRTVAVATHGSVIVLCDVKDNFKPVKVLDTHNAAVTHLDWSADSKFLQSNCRAYELLFHEVDHENLKNSKHVPSASKLKDVQWATQTCTFGYGVQGVFDPLADGTDVNNCDRSPDGQLLASGDDFGYVNVFRYPCVADHPERIKLSGHSSHVMNVRWLADGSHLISVGGNDKTILQFRRTA
jgi:WD40 repeat protein